MCLSYLKIFLPKSTVFVVLYSINAGMRIFPAVYRKETGFSRGEMEKKRNSFSGSLGFVLAAAGSAVGLGNIWRFPYLAAIIAIMIVSLSKNVIDRIFIIK